MEADEEAWLAIAEYQIHRRDPCGHYLRGREVDAIRRKVVCKACKAELDPFDCLLEIAGQHQRTAECLERLRKESEAAKTRLDTLLREEGNARARLERLKAKGAA